jgi:hypothetical protein
MKATLTGSLRRLTAFPGNFGIVIILLPRGRKESEFVLNFDFQNPQLIWLPEKRQRYK